jgi:hypothetical protein
MNPRFAHLLIRLYPRPWRQRYGAEFEEVLLNGQGGLSTLANVAWSALLEHAFPTQGIAMNQNPDPARFQSWCNRTPWAVFGLGPLVLLTAAYLVALFILWSGWQIFLPGADTPFVPVGGPIYGLPNIYFQAGKFYYFGAPVLVGWTIGFIALRHRVKAIWPMIAFVLVTLMGTTNQVRASRTTVPGGFTHICIHFALPHSAQALCGSSLYGLTVLSLTALPYLLWRLRTNRSIST